METSNKNGSNVNSSEEKKSRIPRLQDLLKDNLKHLPDNARVFVLFDPSEGMGRIETRLKRYTSGVGGKLVELSGEKVTEVITLNATLDEYVPLEWEVSGDNLRYLQAALSDAPHESATPNLAVKNVAKLDAVRATTLEINWQWRTTRQGKVAKGKEQEQISHERPSIVMVKLAMIQETDEAK